MDSRAPGRARCRQYVAAIVSNMSSFCIGVMLGWTSPVQPLLMSETPPVGDLPLTQEEVSWIGSINFLGAFLGTFFWGKISDSIGRKRTLCLTAIPFALSWIVMLLANSYWWMIVSRLIVGVGCSGTVINTPLYVAEISEDKRRGSLGSYFLMFLNAGILFSYIVGSFVSFHVFSLICLSVPLGYFFLFLLFPDSPTSLYLHGKKSEAEASLLWFRGGDSVATAKELARLELRAENKNSKTSYKSLIGSRGTIKALTIGMGFSIGQQFCGILAIITYSVTIFREAESSLSPHTSAIIIGLLEVIMSFVSSQLVDRAGRKILILASFLFMTFSLVVLGGYFYLKKEAWDLEGWNAVPLWAMSIHVISYSIGAGPVPFVVLSETFKPEIRGIAMSTVLSVSTILSLASVKTFPIFSKYAGKHGCFWLYSVVCILVFVFTALVLPETKGRTFQSILKELEGEKQHPSDNLDGVNDELCAVNSITIVKSNKNANIVRR